MVVWKIHWIQREETDWSKNQWEENLPTYIPHKTIREINEVNENKEEKH